MFSDVLFVGIVIAVGVVCLVVVARWVGELIAGFVDMLTTLKEEDDK